MKNDRTARASCIVLLACCAVFAATVRAQAATSAASASSAPVAAVAGPMPAVSTVAHELMGLQEDTIVLKAQLKKLDAQAQVAEREAALNRMGRTTTYEEITVLATQSLGDSISATVDVGGRGEFDVHPGDTLADGTRVVAIHPGSVVVHDKDGHATTLTVMSARKVSSRVAAVNGGMSPVSILPLPAPTR
jgi:type IV pilus biogenesis protein PilP